MADHRYVELVIDWLQTEWNSSNYPGSGGDGGGLDGKVPAFVDGDDSDSESYESRRIQHPLEANNAIIVSSSPARTSSFMGSDANYDFEDAVEIRAVGLSAYEGGHILDSNEFCRLDDETTLVGELRRILHSNTEWPDPNLDGSTHAHSIGIFDESNLSSQYQDLYEYSITATLDGYELR